MKQTTSRAAYRQTRPQSYSNYRIIPAIIVMAAIFILSAQPGKELNTVFLPWFQKWFPSMEGFNWGHYAAYFALGVAFDYYAGRRSDRIAVKGWIIIACIIYGLTDEIHQLSVEGRMFDMNDLLHDAIGASTAVLLLSIPIVRRRWRRLIG
ncbi:VanZ family protein [Paenibacillus kobensis]|uniref:VanZ family protein n=1 Tax=Paenibacillus kobensis TaxID=59841 RepID=UPI000FDC371C|nr:VanZ family protein [Paenibacillus kobensis]